MIQENQPVLPVADDPHESRGPLAALYRASLARRAVEQSPNTDEPKHRLGSLTLGPPFVGTPKEVFLGVYVHEPKVLGLRTCLRQLRCAALSRCSIRLHSRG